MSDRSLAAVVALRAFADKKIIPTARGPISWKDYADRPGRVDEESLIQPVVFPAFAHDLLGWDLTVNLAAESSDDEGAPDFTPADSVTHPFVFETKGTLEGTALNGHDVQVLKYLEVGYPRIRTVVLTNVIGARVFDRDEHGALRERYKVDLRGLLSGDLSGIGHSVEAEKLADFIEQFSHKQLTREEKLDRVRESPPWNPEISRTSSAWIVSRVDSIVQLLKSEALEAIGNGILDDRSIVLDADAGPILSELRSLASRIGVESTDALSITDFVDASPESDLGKSLGQFAAHIAFFTTAKLLLVRVWEDLDMLEPMLFDGGFRTQMDRFDDIVSDVVQHAFSRAKERYRPLFDQRNAYSWFVANDDHYVDVIYELANTYFGGIESDVLGQVYERMLERIDRKLLGVYYTPRDIIKLIWDLVDLDSISEQAEAAGRTPRMLDVATGSGGFLVEAATRLRARTNLQLQAGAVIETRAWLGNVADGLNGVEYQRFAAYLAELNLIVQLGHVLATDRSLAIPSMGIVSADTLSLHEPAAVFQTEELSSIEPLLAHHDFDRKERIRAAEANNFLMDAVIGNPPYIGEKLAAPILAATRRDYPYWNNFVGPHMDYLYWFLILGVSKLRDGGRFGFITTEYWMRADGATPLRKYLAEKTTVERIILFRDFRLFPDAKGQHSLIVIGTRTPSPANVLPKVSIYRGPGDVGTARSAILDAIRLGKTAARVDTFNSTLSPNALGGSSWAEVILTAAERKRRKRLLARPQVTLTVSKGVETTLNVLTPQNQQFLTGASLLALGSSDTRHGIQLLSAAEVSALGALNDAEKQVIRRWVNTRDVYPYAVVLPPTGDSIIYLPKPGDLPDASIDQTVSGTPFPDGLPAIRTRLNHFKPLLEANTEFRNERRPWWSLHRAREGVVGDATPDDFGWAPFCLTTRWGGGGRLVVGLAPGGTAPASGLHILRAESGEVPAAYLAGLYNSDLYQEIAESLPPGQLRQADLERIGLPKLSDGAISEIVAAVYELANIVTELVSNSSSSYPLLPEQLRTDVTLGEVTTEVWVPPTGSATTQGTLASVPWGELMPKRAQSTALGRVAMSDDLLGHVITIATRGEDDKVAAEIHLHDDVSVETAEALVAAIRAYAHFGKRVRDLANLPLPTDSGLLGSMKSEDDTALESLLQRYASHRAMIEDALTAHL